MLETSRVPTAVISDDLTKAINRCKGDILNLVVLLCPTELAFEMARSMTHRPFDQLEEKLRDLFSIPQNDGPAKGRHYPLEPINPVSKGDLRS